MNKNGQSIIEYALIAVLVILGVVIMGAYVLRSTNANFKLWDEGIVDSFGEKITQVSQNKVPWISTNCTCKDTPGGCGSGLAGSQCGSDQRSYNHNCSPSQCSEEPDSYCQYDENCCKTYSQMGCGTNILYNVQPGRTVPVVTYPGGGTNQLPAGCVTYGPTETITQIATDTSTGISTGTTTSVITDVGTDVNTDVITIPGTFPGCYYGYEAYGTPCSTLPVACCPAHPACDPKCEGVILYSGSVTACPNQPPASGSLIEDYSYTYVAAESSANCGSTAGIPTSAPCTTCDGRTPCQVYCNQAAGYFPNYQFNTVTHSWYINGCLDTYTVAPILKDCTSSGACGGIQYADPSDPVGHPAEPCTSGACSQVLWGPTPEFKCSGTWISPIWYTTNDCSFEICPTDNTISIHGITVKPTSTDPPCQNNTCCNTAGDNESCAVPNCSCLPTYIMS